MAGYGLVSLTSVNVARGTTLDSPGANADLMATVATDKLAVGGSHFCSLVARWTDANNMYLARVEFTTTQTVLLTLRKRVAGTDTSLTSTYTTPYTHAAGRRFWIRFEVSGTTLRARVWPDTHPDPGAWQLTVTDTDLSADAEIGTRTSLSSANTNTLPVTASWSDFQVVSPQRMTVTRSTNGIVKSHASGVSVSLAQPAIAAL
ncbi:hypothetical protein [Streptomyces sp. NBC_01264]|uniref:hypothetical protein n=1 Tax=Streptomyces sp. NBC_01264 TaxID=2903804 RepID=UPI0022587C18|nr:hypothetical protein [Streptomyces sp. NBC_01264]MCX4778178.1 hypothetical protein [Streptomyces sp. NBC_01264]